MKIDVSSSKDVCNTYFSERSKIMNPTTSNHVEVLRGHLEAILTLENEKKVLKDDRKAEVAAMKSSRLPTAQLLTIYKASLVPMSDREEEHEKLRQAAALLGEKAYVAEAPPLEKLEYDDNQKKACQIGMKRVKNLDEEIKEISVEIKGKYTMLKAEGFDVSVCKKIVSLKLSDGEKGDDEETAALLATYMNNLGW